MRKENFINHSIFIFIILVFLTLFPTKSKALDVPKDDGNFYIDKLNVLSEDSKNIINSSNEIFKNKNKAQIFVLTVDGLDEDVVDYSQKAFDFYKLGDKKLNNGLLILLAKDLKGRHHIRVVTGYGLESILPDGRVGRIIREDMLVLFKEGKLDEGLIKGFNEFYNIVDEEFIDESSNSYSSFDFFMYRSGISFKNILIAISSIIFIRILLYIIKNFREKKKEKAYTKVLMTLNNEEIYKGYKEYRRKKIMVTEKLSRYDLYKKEYLRRNEKNIESSSTKDMLKAINKEKDPNLIKLMKAIYANKMIDKLVLLDYDVLRSKYLNSQNIEFKEIFLDSLEKKLKKLDIKSLISYYEKEDDRKIRMRIRDCIADLLDKMKKFELKKLKKESTNDYLKKCIDREINRRKSHGVRGFLTGGSSGGGFSSGGGSSGGGGAGASF